MAVVIRLSRTGRANSPAYRVTVADSRRWRDGKYLENVGSYNPTRENGLKLDLEKIDAWVKKGAQMSETVEELVTRQKSKAQ